MRTKKTSRKQPSDRLPVLYEDFEYGGNGQFDDDARFEDLDGDFIATAGDAFSDAEDVVKREPAIANLGSIFRTIDECARSGNGEMLRSLLEINPNLINEKCRISEGSPLYKRFSIKRLRACQEILSAEHNPLGWAIINKNVTACEVILEWSSKNNLDIVNARRGPLNITPLHDAVASASKEICELLLSYGADQLAQRKVTELDVANTEIDPKFQGTALFDARNIAVTLRSRIPRNSKGSKSNLAPHFEYDDYRDVCKYLFEEVKKLVAEKPSASADAQPSTDLRASPKDKARTSAAVFPEELESVSPSQKPSSKPEDLPSTSLSTFTNSEDKAKQERAQKMRAAKAEILKKEAKGQEK